MKGWKLLKPLTLKEEDIAEENVSQSFAKVKIIKSLLTLSDLLRYNGEIDSNNVALGSFGIGIISETDANLFGLEKGTHVYIDPYRPCLECYNCKTGEENKCSNVLTAGEDFDGFLRNFASVDTAKLYMLPSSVSDLEALFIEHVSLALSVIDKLGIKKGDYVSIVGANNFGNILAQLLVYYQAVPIVLTLNEENKKIARDSGIYYVLGQEDNWQKEVSAITGGRMTSKVIYISDCNIPVTKAFSLASFGGSVAFTGASAKTSTITFTQAVKKQLNIHCISNGSNNTTASINLIANKAINLSHLKLDVANYNEIPAVFNKMSKQYESTGFIYETIVDLY